MSLRKYNLCEHHQIEFILNIAHGMFQKSLI